MNVSRQLLGGPQNPTPWNQNGLDRLQELYATPRHEPTISNYWRILVKRKWTILVTALVVVTIAGLASLRITPIYEAMARVSIFAQTSNFLNVSKSQTADDSGAQLS